MKLNIRNLIVFVAMGAVALSCEKTPTFERAEKGPEMKVNSFTESAYMSANIKVNLNLSDADFALSTVKAVLYYGETEVAPETLRTKTEGNYGIKTTAKTKYSITFQKCKKDLYHYRVCIYSFSSYFNRYFFA